ncbi:hypothetical protein SUGI_0733470 [Cryptomeria japonica]|nr:hypothetical protein SUGI_0733470 [Cryptomeria japonica]
MQSYWPCGGMFKRLQVHMVPLLIEAIHKAAHAVFPFTEEELLASVANAVKKQQKIRVVTKHSHSIPKLVCPEGETGLIISSSDLNHVVSVEECYMRMSIESSTGLRDLIDSAAEHGLALRHSPYWLRVTVGGMLGSSLFGKRQCSS